MVVVFYKVDIEVILDVVYNYIVEVGIDGFIFFLCGLDNFGYYCIVVDKFQYYINDIGCGNIVNIDLLRILQLVFDSL